MNSDDTSKPVHESFRDWRASREKLMDREREMRADRSREVLKEIDSYNGLPFAKRWLQKKFGAKVGFAFRELKQLGCLKEFPPLVDEGKGLVSQAEHSVIIKDKAIIFTRI